VLSARERGAYYTPAGLAETLCRWAVRPGDRVLDPACGDGVFLRAARRFGARVSGFDIDPVSARIAGAECADFFDRPGGSFDAVVGNPPYVHFSAANSFRKARAAAARLGVTFGAGASSWAPFLVAAADAVRPGGRLAMVVPREALFVDYAHALLAHLRKKFPRVDIICVRDFLFPGALEKVAILLAGPGSGFRIREVDRAADLTPAFLERTGDSEESLGWSRVPSRDRDLARRALDRLTPLSELAEISVGIVTGDKEYFLVKSLPSRAVVASPTWLAGATLKSADLRGRPRLLDIPADYAGGDARIDAYLAAGIRRGVHRRYKCAERACWWRPRIGAPPDAFLTYLNDRLPRLVLNRAAALCTNNLHRVFFRGPVSVGAFYNPATLLSIEIGGRVLGDGALKLEPGDASRILAPRVKSDPLAEVDAALRARDEDRAVRIAGDASGLPRRELEACRRAHAALREVRLSERRRRPEAGSR
jgi:adenine-specific DNA-methyltransferase